MHCQATPAKSARVGADLQQIVVFSAGEGLARVLNWGTMALLPLLCSSEVYGQIGLLISIEILAVGASLMGQDRAVLRFYAQEGSPATLFASVLAIWAGAAWVPLVAVLGFYLAGRETFFGIPLVPHLAVLSLTVAVFNLNTLCVCVNRVRRDAGGFLRFRLTYGVLKFASVVLLAKLLGESVSYVLGFAVACGGMLLLIVPFLRTRVAARPDRAVVGSLLLFGWPLVFHVISGNVFDYFSRFFLEAYSTTEEVGIFTFAYTLGSSPFLAYAILSTYFEPRIYSHANDQARSEHWLAYYTNACIALAAAVGVGLLLASPYLFAHLDAEYARAASVIPMIMGIVLLRPLYLQGNYRLTVYKKNHYIASSTFLGAVLNVGLNIWLVPAYGIWGAAMALYVSSCFLSAFILFVSLRVGRVPLRRQHCLASASLCGAGSLFVVLVRQEQLLVAAFAVICVGASVLLLRSLAARGGQPE